MLAMLLALATAPTPLDRCLNSGDAARGIADAMVLCWVAEHRRADARLNAAYAAALARLPESRRADLRRQERDWIRRRDRACPPPQGEGVGELEWADPPACLAEQTERRTAWLKRLR